MISSRRRQLAKIGELFIAGSCLARGYLHDEMLTREKFVQHLLRTDGRMYRTGDLARWLPDGSIQYVGRSDDQVKIRGNRVELGEIESVLARMPAIRKAAVIVTSDGVDAHKMIIAFIIRAHPDQSFDELVNRLRADVRAFFPDYMRPERYVELVDIPLTANGKTDKSALRALYVDAAASGAHDDPARDPIEQVIVDVFAREIGHQDFRRHDSFFDIGGHSMLVARVVQAIVDQSKVRMFIRDVYECQTTAALAQRLASRVGAQG
jgi:AMP-binding enzyme/AMP-binding enzyme C-terminal domain/Phosphopantetheine attachment site